MGWEERVWGYDGAGGMIQAFAAGYFLWDLMICIRWIGVFGWGLLAHAVAALVVFSLGFVSQHIYSSLNAISFSSESRRGMIICALAYDTRFFSKRTACLDI